MGDSVSNKLLRCIIPSCTFCGHVICCANNFLQQSGEADTYIIPVTGRCPGCNTDMLWRDLVKQKIIKTDDDMESSEDDEEGMSGSQDEDVDGEDDDDELTDDDQNGDEL